MHNKALHWPLMAESGPLLHAIFGDLNDRFREKRTFASYIHWMRDNREIFEFVEGVGCYDITWWADLAAWFQWTPFPLR